MGLQQQVPRNGAGGVVISAIQLLWALVAAHLFLIGLAWTAALPISRSFRASVTGLVAFNLVLGLSLMLIGLRDEVPYFVGHTFSNFLALWALVAVIQAADQLLKIGVSQREIWVVMTIAGVGILVFGMGPQTAEWRALVAFTAVAWMLARNGLRIWRLPTEPHLRASLRSIGAVAMGLSVLLLMRAIAGMLGHVSIEFNADDRLTLALPFVVSAGASLVNLGFAYLVIWPVVEKLRRRASSDELTGLLNRKALMGAINRAWIRFTKTGQGFALICLDVDNLRAVNEVQGYGGGDAVLREIVEALRGVLRPGDVMGRAGGGKMVALLPNTGLDSAGDLAAQMQSSMTGLRLRLVDLPRQVDVSTGIAVSLTSDANDEAVLVRANAQMAAAKAARRKRVQGVGAYVLPAPQFGAQSIENDAQAQFDLTVR